MKFDKIIMNPPYGGASSLYAKIVVEAKRHAKDVICLSPVLAYFSLNQEKNDAMLTNEISPFLMKIEVASTEGFDAAFDKELAIYHLSDNCKNPVSFDELYWNRFANAQLAKSIIDKVATYAKEHSVCSNYKIEKKDFNSHKFKCAMVHKRGNHDKKTGKNIWDWTTFFDEEKMHNFTMKDTDIKTPNCCAIPFNTEIECQNFVDYTCSDIIMFIVYAYKKSLSQTSNLKFIPYLDFTKHWTDSDLCKEFGLTNDEYAYIVEEMKDYGWKTRKCK